MWKETGIESKITATFALAVNRNNVMCLIQHCFIYRPSDFYVWKEAVTESTTFATFALAVKCSNHRATTHPHKVTSHSNTTLDFIYNETVLQI